jgi:Tol biopolymer transport system component
MSLHGRISLTAAALGLFAFAATPGAAPAYSPWSTPTNLGAALNSATIDSGPAVSKDGCSLFFHSDRPGGIGNTDIYVSQRNSEDQPWGAPSNLGAVVNSTAFENVPALSRDEHWLFFHSERAPGSGSFDLWASYRAHTHDNFGWEPPVNLGASINSAGSDAGASYFEHDGAPVLFFGSTRPGGVGLLDIYAAAIVNGQFAAPMLVPELNSPQNDQRPSVRADGLEMILTSDRPGGLGGLDLWLATRDSVSQPWSTPINLGQPMNWSGLDQQAYFSSDRQSLYFASNRPGGSGGIDLYVSTRMKTHRD